MLALLLFLSVVLVSLPQIEAVKAEARTIVVPDDYSTIQAAIDAASENDIVFVKSGTYNESVSIDVSISLIGEDPATTTIIGDLRLSGTVVLIRHNNVNVTGFTIQPSAYSWTRRGFHLLHVSYCNVFVNVILKNEEGIWIYGSSSNNITGNTVSGHGSGILVECSPNNQICGNIVKNNKVGVRFSASPDNTLYNNTITNNQHAGLDVDSDRNNIIENTIEHNQQGIQLSGVDNILKGNKLNNNTLNFDINPKTRIDWGNSQFANDVDSSNTIEGKPIIFWVNKQDQKVTEDAAFVVLINCKNIIVENLNLSKNTLGIILVSTVNSKVTKNSIDVPDYGIFVYNSSSNTIANNFVFNGGTGILLHSSFQNELIGNSITDASIGITLEFSNENIVDGNIILGGFGGIRLDGSNDNTLRKNVMKDCEQLALMVWRNASQNLFYLNSFINNIKNVEEYYPGLPKFPINIWDNGTVGNFWSDYNGTDNNDDGIGDTPYVIDENNQDTYPLTEPYAIPEFPSWLILPLFLAATFAAVIVKKRLPQSVTRYAK